MPSFRRGADGIEMYYYGGRAYDLAAAVHRRLVVAAGTDNRGVRRRGYDVLRHTPGARPSSSRAGSSPNPREGARIAHSPAHRQRLADAIAGGIIAPYR